MTDLFGEAIDHIPEVKKMVKIPKLVIFDIYRVTDEENYYHLFCARSHSHARYLYALDVGIMYIEAGVSVVRLPLFREFIREIDLGTQIEFLDDPYWDNALHKIGGYHEYEDEKITVEQIKSGDIDLEFISTNIPKK